MPNKKKILIVGPHFLVNGKYTGEGSKLYYLLMKEGYETVIKSKYRNKVLRLLDTIIHLLLYSRRYELILIQCYGQLAFVLEDICTAIAKNFNKKIIITIHGGAFFEFYQNNPKWVKKVLFRANIITTPSMFLQEKLKVDIGYIKYIPNAISLNNFKLNEMPKKYDNRLKILWIRGFHDIYNPEIAIYALKELLSMKYNASLTMVGKDGGTLSKCTKLAKELDVINNITFKGFVPNELLNEIYYNHDVLLTTTLYESFGVSLFEAAACGLPNVAIAEGELPYLWSNGHDITFAERNPKDIAEKIIELYFDQIKRTNQIKKAYEKSKNYNLDILKKNWLSLLNK
jgi:glycosyltransferase involved in cell wall biosynthesis